MTRRGPGSRRGEIDAAERALWTKAVANVRPLQADKVDNPGDEISPEPHFEKTFPAVIEMDTRPGKKPRQGPTSRAMSPPLTGLDRRMRQRLARGKVEYEARLDLHGLSVEVARLALLRFLAESAAQGRRLVLVITGKGAAPFARHTLHGASHFDTPERQGRLRRKLPEWLAEDDLRAYVAGYQPAHPRHGGGGAFYVRIRRSDRLGKFR